MRLTSYTNFALRILMYCAVHPGQTVRIEDIARAYGISKAHLLKAARQLGQLGFLKTSRGRSGGVCLGMAPERISVGAVVRELEGHAELVECFNADTNTCPLAGTCRLTALFRRGLEAFFAELDPVSLADITRDDAAFRKRLAVLQIE